MELTLTLAILIIAGDPAPMDVWLDVDTANGVGDVDDGLMLIQCFHSPELMVRGVTVLFGNTTLERAVPIAREITSKFGPSGIEPQSGAAGPEDLGKETAAVRAMAAELDRRRMTILAVGPATNVASLLKLRPDLAHRVDRIVMVAARRPGQKFVTSQRQIRPHPDANFEKDPAGMQVVLDSNVPLVFAPWEVSSHVWLSREDLDNLQKSGGSGEWIARTSQYWLKLWAVGIDERGFNPFDTLAAGYVTHPQLIESMPVRVRIVEDLDDRATDVERAAGKTKPYLIVGPPGGEGREALYCVRPKPQFHDVLLQRLRGRESQTPIAPP